VTTADVPVRLLVLADDLIWSTRLVAQAREAGADASPVRTADAFVRDLPSAQAAIVDLTSRAYDGLAAIAAARDAGVPVLAVGQHDDHVLRRDALSVGADRVLAYRKLFDDGPATIARWLAAAKLRAGSAAETAVATAETESAATR
jgi:DNA-binding response OmpR family regulator